MSRMQFNPQKSGLRRDGVRIRGLVTPSIPFALELRMPRFLKAKNNCPGKEFSRSYSHSHEATKTGSLFGHLLSWIDMATLFLKITVSENGRFVMRDQIKLLKLDERILQKYSIPGFGISQIKQLCIGKSVEYRHLGLDYKMKIEEGKC